MAGFISAPNLQLPWSKAKGEDKFWKIFAALLIPFLILCIAIPLVDVPEKKREDLEKLPPQLARVVIEEKKLPPPPPPEPEPEEEEPEEEPIEEEPEPEPEPEPIEEPEPAKLIEEAREVAEAEINEFADALSDMREAFDLSDAGNELTVGAGEAEEIDRSIIGNEASTGSGGINVGDLSRNTGGVALSGKKNTKVESKLADAKGDAIEAKKKPPRDKSFRSDEDIRKVMDRNKGAVFAIYNRALRKNPALEGKVVFKLVIEPSGKVSTAEIVSSELEDPSLERKLLSRVRLINFGAKEVLQTTLNYSFDFLPY